MLLRITDLVVEGKHGFHQREKEEPQRFRISAELSVNTQAGTTDNIDDTLNWSSIRDKIVSIVQNNSFNLVERLAQEIADKLLEDNMIQKVMVSVDKLDAFKSGMPGVKLTRDRSK